MYEPIGLYIYIIILLARRGTLSCSGRICHLLISSIRKTISSLQMVYMNTPVPPAAGAHPIQKVKAQPSSAVQYQSNSVALLSKSILTIFLLDFFIMRPRILSATRNSSSVHFPSAIWSVQNVSPPASCEAS